MDRRVRTFMTNKTLEAAQPDGLEGEEVGGQQLRGLRTQEGSLPGVATPWRQAQPSGGQDSPDRAHAHAVPETSQFSLDAAVSPGRIL